MIGYLGFIFSDILAAAGFDETESPDVRHVQFEGILLFVLTTKYNVHCTGTLSGVVEPPYFRLLLATDLPNLVALTTAAGIRFFDGHKFVFK